MSMSLDAFRAKLVIIVLYEESAETVERYIETAIHALKTRKINGDIIARVITKVINQFEVITQSATENQMNNIKIAKSCLNRLIGRLTTTTG